MAVSFYPTPKGSLYRPEDEHDACGVGFVAEISGHPSHRILEHAVEAVINLTHRGAVDADAKSGDGAGVLTQIPFKLFQREAARLGRRLTDPSELAVGMVFLPGQDAVANARCREIVEAALNQSDLPLLGWRTVPVDPQVLGDKALRTQPDIQQILVVRPAGIPGEVFERALYRVRKQIEGRVQEEALEGFYIPSLSHRTIVYKGLFVAPQLPRFYLDLQDADFETALAVFHQRYSTNTFPNWFLAQPFTMLAHNGEINTLQGNRNWMRAREPELRSVQWGEQVEQLKPTIVAGGSDSMSLDNVLELVVRSGRDIRHAMMMLIPEAWENMPDMDPRLRAFYEYHACLSEPWDGPAAVAFTDGVVVGAALDRNGLRPARYKVTKDGMIIMASEVGVIEVDDGQVVEKGRLGPGQMIALDTAQGRLFKDHEIKQQFATARPYGEWLGRHLFQLDAHLARLNGNPLPLESPDPRKQTAFGFTSEDLQYILEPMAGRKLEPVGSMGDDTALAVFSPKPRLLYAYFKQKFAQVTNPSIDHLREELVMSLHTYLGARQSILEESPEHSKLVALSNPLLQNNQVEALRNIPVSAFRAATLSTLFPVEEGPQGMEQRLDALLQEADQAVEQGRSILIVSDRGVDPVHAPVPILLAVAAIHHHLIRTGKRMKTSIVAETGEAWEGHHFALLVGYGASAVNPYMAFNTVRGMVEAGELELELEKALANYHAAASKSILKIMSKMGISAVSGYQGAQIFEIVGLNQDLVERCFTGTASRVAGVGLREIALDVLARHELGYGNAVVRKGKQQLPDVGFYRYRRDGEFHEFRPPLVKLLHNAVAADDYEAHRRYAEAANFGHEPAVLRDLLDFKPGRPLPIEEVEPITEIVKRFETASMSFGALSPEAHRTLSTATNRIGAKSNTGEGGEQQANFHTEANFHTKQVASGRFGVTPEYLACANELEIKMAQGSKPGEGGQLPGHKVVEHIALVRHTIPGVTLISPPPHHDIYSIEDLGQLIYDLKQANPRAKIAVKLVSEAGVGTIAAGVAKGYADIIHISGNEGGTGASPWSSIKNAGVPWELGLAETQQVLVLNDLRGRVRLRTDGGFQTGRDVVIAAMLGAEEMAFGTASLVALGCEMARQCHLNTCPVGVATQRPDLRAKFTGTPENVIRFFWHVAQEVREILASLGFRRLDEIIGRVELLQQVAREGNPKVNSLDLSAILAQVDPSGTRPRYRIQDRNNRPDTPLDDVIIVDAEKALNGEGSVTLNYPIRNTNRTVGAKLAGEIAHRYGDLGLPEGVHITCHFQGSAGQSFGAFCLDGLRLVLEGEANDYVGKGMHGGEVVMRPPKSAAFAPAANVILGNTVLYGATGGHLFAAGRAGERFAVRNSGGQAVVEGIGDHGCEYMTGGMVVVLGETGRNFGAGMSGGLAFVLDQQESFPHRYNPELVGIERVTQEEDVERLRTLIFRHHLATASSRAQEVLLNWDEYLPLFWKVTPHPTERLPQAAPLAATAVSAQQASGIKSP